MATTTIQSGNSIGSFGDSYMPSYSDAADIQTALKALYFGSTGAADPNNGIYGALRTLYVGNPTLAGNVTITGDLTVNGDTTTINVGNLLVEDKEIVLGNVASPSNTTANGGGIRLEAGTGVDKTIVWDSANANWTTSENWNIATGKALKINNVNIASGTGAALVLGANASTTIAIGANGGTATILNPTVTLTNATVLNINGASPSIVTTSNGTASVFNTNALTLNVGNAATTASIANSATTLNIGNTATTAQTVNMFTASTGASTYNFATGAVSTSTTKTLNIGTGAGTGGTTNINIGGNPSVSTSNVNLNGTATVNGNLTMSTAGRQLLLANGSSTVAPLKFGGTTVTNNLNATAGTMEYNGKTFIATPNAFSGQAFVATPYHTTLAGDIYITQSGGSTTAFGAAITLGPGVYEFEMQIPFQFTYTSTETTLFLGVKGTLVADGIYFLQEHFSNTGALTNLLLAANVTNTVSSGRVQINWRQNLATQSLNTSNLVTGIEAITSGNRYGVYRAKGWVSVTTQGTFYPAASITGGGNGYIKAGAFAKITPLPSNEQGGWSSQT